MPRPYPSEFRERALELVRAGRTVVDVAATLGIAQSCLYRWKQQDLASRDSWRTGHRIALLPVWIAAGVACVLGVAAVLIPALESWGIFLTGVPVLAGLIWGTVRALLAANAESRSAR